MSKTIVTAAGEEGEAPFLRGILTRSLQEAGMSFDAAYKIASAVRDDISDKAQVSRQELRELVAGHLLKNNLKDVQHNYESRTPLMDLVMVRSGDGSTTPFSRGEHQQRLESCGMPSDEAARITRVIYDHLVKRMKEEISTVRLSRLTYSALKRLSTDKYAHSYLVWTDFLHSGRPLFILIGGTAGSGKSTVATDVANRLEIVRAQSTDMLREVMRVMVPEKLLPVLHASTFNAWKTLRVAPEDKSHEAALLKRGFLTQAELVAVSCEAVLKRAAQERVSVVLEGVHVRPDLLECVPTDNDAVVVPVVLAISSRSKLEKRIKGRGRNAPLRRAERYLKHIDEIWSLQSVLLDEADKAGVAIIANEDKDVAVREVMATVIDAISAEFTSTPAEVFAASGSGWDSKREEGELAEAIGSGDSYDAQDLIRDAVHRKR